MNIGRRIQELRKKHHYTQEQLAEAVNVSIPAVSKWENEASMPDLMLLSPIARFLKTDVNDLIQFTENLTEDEIERYAEEIRSLFETEGFDLGYEKMKSLIQEYPASNYLKVQLVTALRAFDKSRHVSYKPVPDYVRQCEKWLLHVHDYPDEKDHPITKTACLSVLTMLYKDLDELEKMETILQLPKETFDPSLMLTQVYLMQGKLEQAESMFKGKTFNHVLSLHADIKGLYEIYMEKKLYDQATIYADDYYVIASRIPVLYSIPSSLLLEVSLAKKNFDDAYRYLEQCIEELQNEEDLVLPKHYLHDDPEKQSRIWSTSSDTTQDQFIKFLRSNKYASEFLKQESVQTLLEKLYN